MPANERRWNKEAGQEKRRQAEEGRERRDRRESEAQGEQEEGARVGGGGTGQGARRVDTVSTAPPPRQAATPPRPSPLPAHHAQVVHEAGPVGPNVGRRTGQRLHTDLLAAVQLPDGAHHHVHGVEHQGS